MMLSLNTHHSEGTWLTAEQTQMHFLFFCTFTLYSPQSKWGVESETVLPFFLPLAMFVTMAYYWSKKPISQASANNPIIL